MLDSVRVRLTLWYSAVLALVLICLAVLSYFLYWHNIRKRTDGDILQLAQGFITTFNAELADESGPDAVKNAAREAMQEHHFRNTWFIFLDDSGRVQQSSLDLPNVDSPKPGLTADVFSSDAFHSLSASASAEAELHTIPGRKDRFRGLALPLSAVGHGYTLVVLQSLHAQKEMMSDILDTFLWAIPMGLLLASIGGYFLARKSLAPIAAMATQTRAISASNLSQRLSIANERDELGQLAQTFNQLLERLQASFEQQRRFMADASHELRTPVAILKGETEVTLAKADRSPEEYRETLGILREESQRLARITDDLFTLARADAGQFPLTIREAYLDEIASEALVRARSLALAKKIHLCSKSEADLPIQADEALLGRMLLNLLDNAIKYSPAGSTVTLACRRQNDHYEISVSDNGPGIPAELQPRIFERFFRADKARSRADGETGGAGLGLSIARWIAEAHQGTLALTRSDATGSVFTATLPAQHRG
ncbi:MAG TPA: ATP-binding protein [Candidatus Eremiobacteraceae bacterium]|nr:ATP-binding protein [Candidatus Eremiobacteraceae bacterium]